MRKNASEVEHVKEAGKKNGFRSHLGTLVKARNDGHVCKQSDKKQPGVVGLKFVSFATVCVHVFSDFSFVEGHRKMKNEESVNRRVSFSCVSINGGDALIIDDATVCSFLMVCVIFRTLLC